MASAAAAKKWPRLSHVRAVVGADEPEVRLVDQGGGLERLAGLLLGQPLGGELAQLVVDQRQELLGGLGVALLDGREDAGHVGHATEGNCRQGGLQGVPWRRCSRINPVCNGSVPTANGPLSPAVRTVVQCAPTRPPGGQPCVG